MRRPQTDDEGNDDMLPEFDFSQGVRGKHAARYRHDHTVTVHAADGGVDVRHYTTEDGAVVLDPDVRVYFPNSESVNAALRGLIALAPKKRAHPKAG
jgi:hypothetical protein